MKAIFLPSVSLLNRGPALQIKSDGHKVTSGCKLDLNIGLIPQEIRPRYTYEAGRIRFGDFETDATHFYADISSKQLYVAFTEGTGLYY